MRRQRVRYISLIHMLKLMKSDKIRVHGVYWRHSTAHGVQYWRFCGDWRRQVRRQLCWR